MREKPFSVESQTLHALVAIFVIRGRASKSQITSLNFAELNMIYVAIRLFGRGSIWLRISLIASLFMPILSDAEISSPVPPTLEEAKTSQVNVQFLRSNVSILFGSGGNIAVLSTSNGKFLVDAGIAVSREKLEAALKNLSNGPVRYVVNTHYHWDHTDGNAWLHEAGATIAAHRNALKRLSTTTRVIEWGFTFPPTPAAALPTVIVDQQKKIDFDGESIVIRNFGSGHTDGDLAVYFSKADILMTGDIWWNGLYPFIDYGAGGGINGMITWVDELLKMSTDRTIIVPGHGPIGTRAQLVEYRQMLYKSRGRISALKRRGNTLSQILSQHPTLEYDEKFGKYWIDPAFFTMLVYNGV
jgi:glyoxylase-like metal-dependent hydrolase (beta-lactamase superfamily II)